MKHSPQSPVKREVDFSIKALEVLAVYAPGTATNTINIDKAFYCSQQNTKGMSYNV